MNRNVKAKILSFLLACITLFLTAFLVVQMTLEARAEGVTYSGALEDLQKDSSFQASNYPEDPADVSLQVIQLAESADRELFVYVYQPSGGHKNLIASSINISTTIHDAVSFVNYKLDLLNSDGVFYKYKVRDFTVRNENVRYYEITSIYRPFDATVDAGAGNGNTVTEVNYAVSKQYSFGTINGRPYVNCVDIDTIVVTDKFVGYVRYPGGFAFYAAGACDSHFVAFSTDRPIDKLYEADVYYVRQTYSKSVNTGITMSEGFSNRSEEYVTLVYTDKASYTGPGIGAGTYRWERIESVPEFISNVETDNVYSGAVLDVTVGNRLTDAARAALENKQWVLRFAETPYSYEHYSSGFMYQEFREQTFVGDVTILRLKFETDGITYNLGVIDNKQTGSEEPVNETTVKVTLNPKSKSFLWIIWLILIIVLLVVLAPVLPLILRAAVWLISLPFKGIAALIGFVRERRQWRKERKIYKRVIATIDDPYRSRKHKP